MIPMIQATPRPPTATQANIIDRVAMAGGRALGFSSVIALARRLLTARDHPPMKGNENEKANPHSVVLHRYRCGNGTRAERRRGVLGVLLTGQQFGCIDLRVDSAADKSKCGAPKECAGSQGQGADRTSVNAQVQISDVAVP